MCGLYGSRSREHKQIQTAEELGARIFEYRYRGMRAVYLENELLRVGVLADKATDVSEVNHKPAT
jgi:hypothetical protein